MTDESAFTLKPSRENEADLAVMTHDNATKVASVSRKCTGILIKLCNCADIYFKILNSRKE